MWKHFVELRTLLNLLIIFENWIHLTEHFLWLLRLQPRVLVDVSRIDLSTTVLGYRVSAPIMIAPTAMHKLAHPEGLNLLGREHSQLKFVSILITC